MPTEQPRYLAYMLRLCQVRDNDEMVWRASLEDAHTGERHGFASLELLVAFLQEQVGVSIQIQARNHRETFGVAKTSEV